MQKFIQDGYKLAEIKNNCFYINNFALKISVELNKKYPTEYSKHTRDYSVDWCKTQNIINSLHNKLELLKKEYKSLGFAVIYN